MRKITKAVLSVAYEEYDYSQLLSEYAWKRYLLLKQGKLDVDAEMARIEAEERVHWSQDPKWAHKRKGPKIVDGIGMKVKKS